MIKKTLYFSNPCYLSVSLQQLLIDNKVNELRKIPIEDIGIIVLDHAQITISHQVLRSVTENNGIIISCNEKHMPSSLMLTMEGHHLQSAHYQAQVEATLPLKKQLWQQTIQAKIANQSYVLKAMGKNYRQLDILEPRVQSGDISNVEGQAAYFYWNELFDNFKRERYGDPPNDILNYGYAIIRAMVARALVGSGLSPTLGIHHSNQYNAYCLADDIMEPFRPFVDITVCELIEANNLAGFLDKETKVKLLNVPTMDGLFGKKKSPLMVGLAMTTASLCKCYTGKARKIIYPTMI